MFKIKNQRCHRHYSISFLNNYVDKDVQNLIYPMNLMETIIFCPTYRIESNFIAPNKFIYNLIAFLGTIGCIILFIYRTYMLFDDKQEHFIFTADTYFECIFYCFGFAMNFMIGFTKTNNKIRFVLTFKNVHRFLNKKSQSRSFVIWNSISILMAIGCYMSVFSYICFKFSLPLYTFISCCLLVSFDLYIVYAIEIIKLLKNKVDLWNIHAVSRSYVQNEVSSKKMFQAYVDILECYDIYKDYFQYSILFYILEVFFHSLFYVEMALNIMKLEIKVNEMDAAPLGLLSLIIWLIKNLMWLITLSKRCEKFYLAVQNIHDSCTLIIKSHCSENEKKLYKNVVRLHRASFSKLSACGLFYVDAALQLSLMGLLSNYTIVLLQFRFL